MITTTIHRLGQDGRCTLCQHPIPEGHVAKVGEYVGIISSDIRNSENPYRIGEHNKDSLCTGAPHSEFFQKSIEDLRDQVLKK